MATHMRKLATGILLASFILAASVIAIVAEFTHQLILRLGGILLILDGYGNIVYWKWKKEADTFIPQLGRAIRGTVALLFTLLIDLFIK